MRDLRTEASELTKLLDGSDIKVLREFEKNQSVADSFSSSFCNGHQPKTILCGINPGRLGAGKTGVPFLDFCSISKLLPSISRSDSERSAQFFFEIVEHFGVKAFYAAFHVTNISSVGFEKSGKNVNYYDLPEQALGYVHTAFQKEVELVQPNAIISLAGSVHSTVKTLFPQSEIDISGCLPHPNYCAFPKQRQSCKTRYIEHLSQYVG